MCSTQNKFVDRAAVTAEEIKHILKRDSELFDTSTVLLNQGLKDDIKASLNQTRLAS